MIETRIVVAPSDTVAVHGADEPVEFECVVNARSVLSATHSPLLINDLKLTFLLGPRRLNKARLGCTSVRPSVRQQKVSSVSVKFGV